ncbi:MAG TPA: 2-polyprenylphenol 6-hydroxylase [Gammaproteobacteria bacterium]|nr:2-polyprenylphenol 6-hydroxylase [Gammaproteobacteria bacterium]
MIQALIRMMAIFASAIYYSLDEHLTIKPSSCFGLLIPPIRQRKKNYELPERLTQFLTHLGPVFIKFGQALSTRTDMLPAPYILALSKLQDNVPPFDNELAQQRITQSLHHDVNDIFKDIEKEPLASASIAQVYSATLMNNEEVVIKVTRPDIRKKIHKDIDLMRKIAWVLELFMDKNQTRLQELISEFETTIFDELDMIREGANYSQLKKNFSSSDQLYVPKVYWDHTTQDVLVLEKIHGLNINKISQLKKHGVNLKKLAENGVNIFFTQVFRDSFFHADMHPGNVFVDITQPKNPKYIAIDFGIMGSLNKEDQYYIAAILMAFFKQDYRKIATLHIECGWVSKNTRVDQFESAIRSVLEPIFARPIKDISFGLLLMRLFHVGKRFKLIVQPQLLLLQKTLMNIEGLGRELYPDLNLWDTGQPYLEKWLSDYHSVYQLKSNFQEQWPKWLHQYPEIPNLLLQQLKQPRPLPPSPPSPLVYFLSGMAVTVLTLIMLQWTIYV